ncbi:MAG: hypothetical protein V3U28_09920 [Candidatus Acidoferrales bacterium]
MEFRYSFGSILRGVVFWLLLALALLWWGGGKSFWLGLAWIAIPTLVKELQRLRQRVRVEAEGLTVGKTTVPWKQIRRVEMKGWGPWRYLEFYADDKKKLRVNSTLENYQFFATLVQQWLPPDTERPESLLA